MKMTGAEIVIRTMINHGVDEVFGFPGGAVLSLYDAVYTHRDQVKHYTFCHEQGAAHAADGYARATGKTGVVIATSGPGATNLVTGIATAYLDSTPMIAITGNVPLNLIGKDSFQEVDIAGITMPITKHNYIVKDINELEDIVCEAFQIARSNRPGPVLIDIPKDIQLAECEFKGGEPWELFPHPTAETISIAEAVELINESKKPYIYAGGGVVISGAYDELVRFADKIDAPIGCSMMGLSSVDHKNPRKLGMTGMHGTYAASKAKSESDLIIGIGVRFSDRATGNIMKYQENAKILHIDIDKAEISKNIRAYNKLIGNIKDILPVLTDMTEQKTHADWMTEINGYVEEAKSFKFPNESVLRPKGIIRKVSDITSDDTVIVTDVGQHQVWVAQYFRFSNPRTFLTSGGLGTMGFGLGASIGAALGSKSTKKKKTILFTGDGSFHMNMNEFATAVMYNIPLIIVIIDNAVLGMVRQWQSLFYEDRYSNTTMNRVTDYVKLAESFGGIGYKVTSQDEFDRVIELAMKADQPVLIDCVIDKDEKVLPMIPPESSIEDIIVR
jgi:acetolactate synthase, large subunit, biosynthetic type